MSDTKDKVKGAIDAGAEKAKEATDTAAPGAVSRPLDFASLPPAPSFS